MVAYIWLDQSGNLIKILTTGKDIRAYLQEVHEQNGLVKASNLHVFICVLGVSGKLGQMTIFRLAGVKFGIKHILVCQIVSFTCGLRIFSTSVDVQYIGEVLSTPGGYHDSCRGACR